MKRVLSVILCLSMLIVCLPVAYAESGEESEVTLEQYVDYANSVIPGLAKLPDVDFPSSGLYISQPIEILNDNDDANYALFLFDQDSCIGEVVVSYVNDSFTASFLYCDMPAVSAAYLNARPIVLVSEEKMLLLCSETSTDVIIGNGLLDIQDATIPHFDEASGNGGFYGETLSLTSVTPSEVPYSSGLPSSSKTLNIPFVANESAHGNGLCWAAVAASFIRYKTGNSSVTAKGVYNTVLIDTGMDTGVNAAVVYGLTVYGVPGYVGIETDLPFSTVVKQINADYPVYMAISGKNGNTNAYHAVGLCGHMSDSDGTDYIQIMDPNVSSGKIWIVFNRNTNAFSYATPNGPTYTSWYWSVYSSLVA